MTRPLKTTRDEIRRQQESARRSREPDSLPLEHMSNLEREMYRIAFQEKDADLGEKDFEIRRLKAELRRMRRTHRLEQQKAIDYAIEKALEYSHDFCEVHAKERVRRALRVHLPYRN